VKAFSSDWAVREYAITRQLNLPIEVPRFVAREHRDALFRMLSAEPERRPTIDTNLIGILNEPLDVGRSTRRTRGNRRGANLASTIR
jgi:hypothetical protein